LPAFGTFKREGIELQTGFTATVNAELKVGSLEETVTVSGRRHRRYPERDGGARCSPRNRCALPVGLNTGMYATLIPAAKVPTTDSGRDRRVDVGGTQSERSTAVFSVHGGTNDMKLTQDGLQFTRGAGGATTWKHEPDGHAEVNVQVGGITAEAETGGHPDERRAQGGFPTGSRDPSYWTARLRTFQSDNIGRRAPRTGRDGIADGETGLQQHGRRVWRPAQAGPGVVLRHGPQSGTRPSGCPGKFYNATQGTPVFHAGRARQLERLTISATTVRATGRLGEKQDQLHLRVSEQLQLHHPPDSRRNRAAEASATISIPISFRR